MIPLASASSELWVNNIKLIASDMDGTITNEGRFTSALFNSLELLRQNNIKFLLITGRSAGWVNGLASLLPIDGAIAENGGIFFQPQENDHGIELIDMPGGRDHHRAKLRKMFVHLQSTFLQIKEAPDNIYRITDWTFSVHGLSPVDLQKMAKICTTEGFAFTYSNVQCHILLRQQTKANALLRVLHEIPELACSLDDVVTLGDSPNDESLFDNRYFEHSVGVANLGFFANSLAHRPKYVTRGEECSGFVELVELLCKPSKF